MVTSIRIRVTHVVGGEEQGVREDPCIVDQLGLLGQQKAPVARAG